MPKALLLALCLCCPLAPRISSAQAVPELSPVVVRLDAGDVARQAYVAMDTTTYRLVRQQLAQVPSLRQRVALLEYDRTILSGQVAQQHGANTAAAADFGALSAEARALLLVKPRPPFLLDGRLYQGAGAGVVLALLYVLLRP